MGILEHFRAWRRKRLIKRYEALGRNGAVEPGRLRTRWTHWIRGDYTLRNSELLFSAVSRIANTLSAMPLRLYKGSEPVKNDLSDLVSFSPNPNMTASYFVKVLETCRDTYGNAYALKVLENGVVARLDPLDPGMVTPMLEESSGELWYRVHREGKEDIYLHNWYVIHIPFLSANGMEGINPVSVLNGTLDYAANVQRFSIENISKGINAAVVFEAPANLGDTQRKKMLESFREVYRESGGNVLLLESGVTAKSLNLSPVDTKLFEVEKITRSKVAMVYNLPPHLLGDYSDTSFASQEQQMLEFLTLTMLPIVTAYEDELNRKLLTKNQWHRGYRFRFSMDSILRADAATQAEVNYKGIRSGWLLPDEVRAEQGKGALPGGVGKVAMVSQDLAPLDYTVNTKPKVLARKLENGGGEA